MPGEDGQTPFKKLLDAVGFAFIAPMAIAPFAAILVFLSFRLSPRFEDLVCGAFYCVFGQLIPESSGKGFLFPILIVTSPSILLSDLVGAVLAWRVLRSWKPASIAFAISVSAQLAVPSAAGVFFELSDLIWH